ncbi:hypothetical protein ACT7DH_13200 [Bacillus pacificus]
MINKIVVLSSHSKQIDNESNTLWNTDGSYKNEINYCRETRQGLALVSQFKYRRKDGYLEVEANELFPNGAYCTWAIGHLTQLCNSRTLSRRVEKMVT